MGEIHQRKNNFIITMKYAFFDGVGFGFTLSLMIGPVFFGLMYLSIVNGFKSGLIYSIGVLFSDLVLISIAISLASVITQNAQINYLIILIGAITMCIMGIYYIFFSKPFSPQLEKTNYHKHIKPRKAFIKGFMMNTITPTVLIFWVGTSSFVSIQYASRINSILFFFVGCLLTLFTTDIIKTYLAHKIRTFLKPQYLSKIQVLLGIIILGFGCFALLKLYYKP
ncbi:MAG: hypothetical protein EAZ07_04345 [Cytophagales bacterium]|nr:MAG: hypothetical protein EAZ07_04345 [Cytophagales bacterium]